MISDHDLFLKGVKAGMVDRMNRSCQPLKQGCTSRVIL